MPTRLEERALRRAELRDHAAEDRPPDGPKRPETN